MSVFEVLTINIVSMKTRIIKAILLVFFIPLIASGQYASDSVLSLKTCIQLSFANNLKLKQAQLETEKSRYQLKEAISSGLPQVNGFTSFDDYFDIPVTMVSGEILGQPGTMVPIKLGTKYNVNAGMQAGQMIYNASYFASVRLFKKSCEITNLNFQKSKEELAYNVSQIYLFIQITNEQLALLDSNLFALRKVYSYSEQHYKNGFIRKADLDRVTVAINNLETEKENLLLTHNQQLNMLKYLIGIRQNQTLILSDKLEDINVYLISTDTTFKNQTEVKLMEKQKELATISLKLARADHLPSLSGYACYSYQAPVEQFGLLDNNNNWYKTSYVGIKLSIPIFEGTRVRSKVSQHKIEFEQINIGQMDLQNELNVKYKNALQKYYTCKSLESKQNANMKLSENIFKITNEQYRQGLKSFTDVLNAQSEYNTSNQSWLNSLLQIKLSELEILKLSGTINTLFL
jgi:outer membrane protein